MLPHLGETSTVADSAASGGVLAAGISIAHAVIVAVLGPVLAELGRVAVVLVLSKNNDVLAFVIIFDFYIRLESCGADVLGFGPASALGH